MDKPELYRLIEKYLDKQASEEEKERLVEWFHSAWFRPVEWFAASAEEEEQVRLRMLNQLRTRLAAQTTDGIPGKIGTPAGRVLRISLLRVSAVAAILLLVISAVLLFNRQRSGQNMVYIYNPAGKIRHIELPDGSEGWLNANSHLHYPVDFLNRREVTLEGEAFFDVRHGETAFIVHTDKLDTRVLGTSFTVDAYKNEAQTGITVKNGKVSVHAVTTGKDIAVLQAGQQVIYDRLTAQTVIGNTAVEDVPGWRRGELSFRFLSLEKITQQLENWYGYRFEFSDDSLKGYTYNGSFKNSIQLKDLVSLLCEINNIHFTIDDKDRRVILSAKKTK